MMGIFGSKPMSVDMPPALPSYDDLDRINWEVNSNRKLRDCQWYTLFKRQKLEKMGYQPQALYVRTPRADPNKPGPNHVVLRMGDWVLDNIERRPFPYKDLARHYQEVAGFTDADVYAHSQGKWVPK